MELQTTKNAPRNAAEILQSISRKIDLARDLVSKCQTGTSSVSDAELRLLVSQLEEVTKHIGEDLSSIPPSTFEDQNYVRVAVRSLSDEMQHACFRVAQSETEKQGEVETQPKQTEEAQLETDLYSVNVEVSMMSSNFSIESDSSGFSQSIGSILMKPRRMSRNSTGHQFGDQFVEPMYGTFYCPLLKKIMEDPVTTETGVTYERKAIAEWFNKFDKTGDFFCPTTGKKLSSRVLSTNMALKTTIEEWKDRNEAGRIKIARAALSLASSPTMVLEAIEELAQICKRKCFNKVQVCNIGILPKLVKLLGYKDRSVRSASLDLLRQLAEDDNDGKEMIANSMDLSILVRMLSSSHQATRKAALLLLLELSKSQSLCKKIGSVNGAMLVLISTKYNSTDSFAPAKATEILRNLESWPNNIKYMAENGYVEPLLNHLTEGNEEIKQEMATYLGEIYLDHDTQTYVAERAASSLMAMVQRGNGFMRTPGFKALARISTYHPNSKVLVEAGIVPLMIEEMFNRQISDDMMNSKAEAASILANIIDSGIDLEKIEVNSHGHTMASDYIVYNIVYMLGSSTPDELNINLIKILLCMTKSEKLMATIVSVLKENEGSYTLIELINNPEEELSLAAIKLLLTVSSHIGHMISERLCKTNGLPENLIQMGPSMDNQIMEKQAISAKFLDKLPHKNLTLNLAILNKGLIPDILHNIEQVQRSGTRSSKYGNTYLEGLTGILVRFTTTLYDPQIITVARKYNFTSVFTDLLTKASSDEVQRLSATGLKNLSAESVNLSKPPEMKKPKFMKVISLPQSLSFRSSSRKLKMPVCPVHRGACSSQNTFCLIDAKAVERLLGCLQHENAEVVEAALSALCTLLDDGVDVDKSLNVLNGSNAVQHVLNVVKDHREERLWQKSFWMIERFLARGGDDNSSSTSCISQDRLLHTALITAFHRGDGTTKQVAERILRHLNKMPQDSSSICIASMSTTL
ncbi:hypothetical protein CDL15_Pgr009504 [Punica granatum]|nr:hypothetical protein CDL15_Pgr009504 [Punica granatum]PKI64437.1 hypothetical protein CRG98_015162 [Punica granatum]